MQAGSCREYRETCEDSASKKRRRKKRNEFTWTGLFVFPGRLSREKVLKWVIIVSPFAKSRFCCDKRQLASVVKKDETPQIVLFWRNKKRHFSCSWNKTNKSLAICPYLFFFDNLWMRIKMVEKVFVFFYSRAVESELAALCLCSLSLFIPATFNYTSAKPSGTCHQS